MAVSLVPRTERVKDSEYFKIRAPEVSGTPEGERAG